MSTNDKNKKGFSGLSDLASEVSINDDFSELEPSLSQSNHSQPTSETTTGTEDDLFFNGGRRVISASSTSSESGDSIFFQPIESVKSGRKSGGGWKWILGLIIFGVITGIVVIGVANNGGQNTNKTSSQINSDEVVLDKPVAANTPSPPELPLPYSGDVRTYTAGKRIAPFEIKAAQGSHYLVKLVDAYTHTPVLTVFVRSGSTVNIDVPLGTYEVRYASGESWYGYKYLFGPAPDTDYSKADKTFTFEVVGNQVSGFTITLYKVASGNLHTSTIKPAEF